MEQKVDTNSLSSWSTVFLIILENLDSFHIVFPDISKEKIKANQINKSLDLVSVARAREITNRAKTVLKAKTAEKSRPQVSRRLRPEVSRELRPEVSRELRPEVSRSRITTRSITGITTRSITGITKHFD